MEKKIACFFLLLIFANGLPSASASAVSPARIVSGFFSNAVSHLLKRIWTLTSTPKTVVTAKPQMKFESGYSVETVFDGSKLGIEPFSVEVAPNGELLVLDSVNSNIYKIPLPLSIYSRPKLVAGSAEGYAGHVDGRPREARMNHPKGFAVDNQGNIYVADTSNMVVRKISDAGGVTTIAGGKWSRGGHTDGPSEDAKFSNDFEVLYVASSCSLLVVDRGNQAIREIQLHFDDCAYKYDIGFPLEIAVLLAAGFFGYMLALLQRRVGGMVSSKDEILPPSKSTLPPAYQKPMKQQSVRPPLIPTEDDQVSQEEGLLTSIGKLVGGAKSSMSEIFGAIFFRKKPKTYLHQNYYQNQSNPQQQQRRTNTWPMQESFEIPDEDEPPPVVETRTPTPKKTYPFMSKDPEKIHHLRQGRGYSNGWDGSKHVPKQHVQHHRQQSLGSQTYYEQSSENTNEIVFGAVQEFDGNRRKVEIKAVNYDETIYDHYGLRSRMQYSNGNDNGF